MTAVVCRAGSPDERGHASVRGERSLRFEDDDGLGLELVVADPQNPPLRAEQPGIPREHAITGVEGARADSVYANVEQRLLTETLGFTWLGRGECRLDGEGRRSRWDYDAPPPFQPQQGAGGFVSEVRDHDSFDAISFLEPRGILFEIATLGPGFAVDEDPDRLGEELHVPKMHDHLREELERTLTPLVHPRTARREKVGA